jgi:hypothetical protein
MAHQALFAGLVSDEIGRPVDVATVGGQAFYVVDDEGFKRHIESEKVDHQVLENLRQLIEGNEEFVSESTMKMLGQEDIFTKAAIESSLKKMGEQFGQLIEAGLPDEARAWLGMVGFRVVIDMHGEVLRVEQPGEAGEADE